MKIAIIGGGGKMGRWFSRQFLSEEHEVTVSDTNQESLSYYQRESGVQIAPGNTEAVKGAKVILLSVPIDRFEAVVKEISASVHPEQVVLDVTSVKVAPVEAMHRYLRTPLILGTHPVFGPGAVSFSGHSFVLTPTNETEKALAEKVKTYLEARGAGVSLMTPEEHDRLMSVVLGLAHFIAIVSAETLVGFGGLEKLKAVGGVTYKALLTLIESVISEDPSLYASLQMSLPNMTEIHELFLKSAGRWRDLVK
ncbi:MAG: prephenate dehydrogenase, partial [Chloroflexota bacterium]